MIDIKYFFGCALLVLPFVFLIGGMIYAMPFREVLLVLALAAAIVVCISVGLHLMSGDY